ncbi:MAG: thioredoxin fold domain-containing protein [Planctomycetaceae bacterium]
MIRTNVLLLVLVFSVHCLSASGQQSVWHRTLADAQRQAAEEGRTLLIHFSGDSCPYCVKMDREVFSSRQVQQQLRRSVAAVYLNRDVDLAAAMQFGVRLVPTDILIFPDGTRRNLVGGKSQAQFLQLLAEARGRNIPPRPSENLRGPAEVAERSAIRPSDSPAADYQVTGKPVQPEPVVTGQPAEQPADFVEVDPVTGPGLEGFCPVALRELRQWKPGLERFSGEYQGVIYRFCSAPARAAFLANPRLYAPEVQGYDPVILAQDRRAVTGNVRYGVWLDGRLFLFQDAANRQAFKDAPQLYSGMRSAVGSSDTAELVRR